MLMSIRVIVYRLRAIVDGMARRSPPIAASLCALALLACLPGCGDSSQGDGLPSRPSIEATERRCGPLGLIDVHGLVRLMPSEDGDVFLFGNTFDLYHQDYVGRVARVDPTGERVGRIRNSWHVFAAGSVEELAIVTDRGRLLPIDPETLVRAGPAYGQEHLFSKITAPDIVRGRDLSVYIGGQRFENDWPAVKMLDRSLAEEAVIYIVAPPIDTGSGFVGRVTALHSEPDAGEAGVLVGGVIATTRTPEARHGFVATLSRDVPPSAFGPTPEGRVEQIVVHPQIEFEPLRIVPDRHGHPWALAVEGHEGDRYVEARPMLVRIHPRTLEFVDRIRVPLPPNASQGGILAAIQLPGGDWLLGGSVCGGDRSWCQAWLLRMAPTGEVRWQQRTGRDTASTVTDLLLVGDRVLAGVTSSPYCCEWYELDYGAWLWELDLDGTCPDSPGLRRDGVVLY